MEILGDKKVAAAALTISKSASPITFTRPGQVITYTYTITNTGGTSTSLVSVVDNKIILPIPLVPIPLLLPAQSQTVQATYTVTSADIVKKSITNTAYAKNSLGTVVSSKVSVTINLLAMPLISITGTANATMFSKAGQIIIFTLTIVNTGNVTLTNIAVTDPKISNFSPGSAFSLDSGASRIITANYKITEKDISAASLTNTTFVLGKYSTVTVSGSSTITIPGPIGSLLLSKSKKPDNFSYESQVIIYTYHVINNGNIKLYDVHVTDTGAMGPITPPSIDLEPGESKDFTASYVVKRSDINIKYLSGTAIAYGSVEKCDCDNKCSPKKVALIK